MVTVTYILHVTRVADKSEARNPKFETISNDQNSNAIKALNWADVYT
jgi:hypothetical protein